MIVAQNQNQPNLYLCSSLATSKKWQKKLPIPKELRPNNAARPKQRNPHFCETRAVQCKSVGHEENWIRMWIWRWKESDREGGGVSFPILKNVSQSGCFQKQGTPKWMVKIMEHPIKMDDLGIPLFLETPKSFCFPGTRGENINETTS